MLEDRARELGRLIGQSDEYKAVKRANDALADDPELTSNLKELEELRLSAQRLIENGEEPTMDMETRLQELLGSMQVNATYQRAIVAQENFSKTMSRVNDWIQEGMAKGAASSIITLS